MMKFRFVLILIFLMSSAIYAYNSNIAAKYDFRGSLVFVEDRPTLTQEAITLLKWYSIEKLSRKSFDYPCYKLESGTIIKVFETDMNRWCPEFIPGYNICIYAAEYAFEKKPYSPEANLLEGLMFLNNTQTSIIKLNTALELYKNENNKTGMADCHFGIAYVKLNAINRVRTRAESYESSPYAAEKRPSDFKVKEPEGYKKKEPSLWTKFIRFLLGRKNVDDFNELNPNQILVSDYMDVLNSCNASIDLQPAGNPCYYLRSIIYLRLSELAAERDKAKQFEAQAKKDSDSYFASPVPVKGFFDELERY